MEAFLRPLHQLSEFKDIEQHVNKAKGLLQVSGCIDFQKPHMIYGINNGLKNKIIVTFSEQKAKELYESYRFFDSNVMLYPARDILFYQSDLRGNLLTKERLNVVRGILENVKSTVITTFDGLMDRLVPIQTMEKWIQNLQVGSVLVLDSFAEILVEMGYERNYQVEQKGQYAIRGGIIDIYPLTDEHPYRIELWDDEIDSIRSFEVESQRSIDTLDSVRIFPAVEILLTQIELERGLKKIQQESEKTISILRREMKTEEAFRLKSSVEGLTEQVQELGGCANVDSYITYFLENTVSFLDYFNREDTIVFLDEPARVVEKGKIVEQEFSESVKHRLEKGYILPGQMDSLYSYEAILGKIQQRPIIGLATLDGKVEKIEVRETYHLNTKTVSPYNNSFETLVKDLKRFKKLGYQVILLSGSRTRAQRLAEDLREWELNSFYTEDYNHLVQSGEIMVMYGKVRKGYEYPDLKFVVISESDIFGVEKKKKKRKIYEGEKIQTFTELGVGDFVVHENHGLGIYRGIEKVCVDKVTKDYIKIEYDKGGNLYILASQLNLIQKYAGADAKKPKLNRLGGQEWSKTKSRVRGAVKEIAKELVELYAVRQSKEGFVYGEDTVWQREFEEMFPFEETDDQVIAIEATKQDMESTKIMDRLICGDVGYGKTEIAIRAAFKAVQEGKQVVYLVPTTILAQQHYNTFARRMQDFPVRVDLLCRFRTPAQQKKTIHDLQRGLVDVIIGTHRVLSKDVVFKDLGLLIVDEEQRFGVGHKEKIKQLKTDIDVLTLTATPIPRTLHMSLIGIRDMSVLEEPPMDRVPIQTFVMEYNEEMVREAIHRELAREGQVYYVYNRVHQIEDIAGGISKLVPDANVAYAHGQMKERELEKIMYDFINGEIDVLVSTTIIETGLDISNVNTMIIHDADNLGLSQLYQLRGRVGRSNRTAYAFLMYKRNKVLKEIAEKRLHAIREFTELGSGFKIAMRDLEIRGAGNLLGAQQHGNMESVGYDLYCKMLNEAVKSYKGIPVEEKYDTTIDLDIDAFIPEKYIPNEFHKLDIYKRIASIETEEECDEMLEELIDRFGEPPKPVQNLLFVANLKSLAHRNYIIEIAQKVDTIKMIMFEKAEVMPQNIPVLIEKYDPQLKFTVDTNPYFTYYYKLNSKQKTEDVLEKVKEILIVMHEIIVLNCEKYV